MNSKILFWGIVVALGVTWLIFEKVRKVKEKNKRVRFIRRMQNFNKEMEEGD